MQVRVQMVNMLRGYTRHCHPVSEAALALWVQCVTDVDLRVRMAFATSVDALLNCNTDTLSSHDHISRLLVDRLVELKPAIAASQLDSFLATLVKVSQGSLPKSATNELHDCLLSLYFSASTNVTTYARALEPLQLALLSDKSRVMGWCAKAMCRQEDDPRHAVHWLKLLCRKEVSVFNCKDFEGNDAGEPEQVCGGQPASASSSSHLSLCHGTYLSICYPSLEGATKDFLMKQKP